MKTVYKEFCCPECGELRYINVNGICFNCKTEKTLILLAEQRKIEHNFEPVNHFISIDNYT